MIMLVKIISIRPGLEPGKFNVEILIGSNKDTFTFTIIADGNIQGISSEERFSELFIYHPMMEVEICNLVWEVYAGKTVELPMDVGAL